jgi:microcystin-dependent protein
MSDQFVAEIRIFAGNFAPTGWALCNGQVLPISQNTALFSLLGTYYGGDGKSTFALPDLQGSVPIHQGQGGGLSARFVGETSGAESVTLLGSEMPRHAHAMMASPDAADHVAPAATYSLAVSNPGTAYQDDTGDNLVNLAWQTAHVVGGSLPHNNLQPYLVLNFIIALQGIYPARS